MKHTKYLNRPTAVSDGLATEYLPLELKGKLNEMMLQRTKRHTLEMLPSLQMDTFWWHPSEKIREHYAACCATKVEDGSDQFCASMERFHELRNILNAEDSPKFTIITSLVKGYLALGEFVIISSICKERTLNVLEKKLKDAGLRVGRIDGDVRPTKRQDIIESDAFDVLLLSTLAAGEGIDLPRYSRVIIANLSWTPAHDDQLIARAHRFGQTKMVHVVFLISAGTIGKSIKLAAFLLHCEIHFTH